MFEPIEVITQRMRRISEECPRLQTLQKRSEAIIVNGEGCVEGIYALKLAADNPCRRSLVAGKCFGRWLNHIYGSIAADGKCAKCHAKCS